MSKVKKNYSLARQTTFGLRAVAKEYLRVETSEELVAAVREAKLARKKFFVLAGGSNVVFPERYAGLVIHYVSKEEMGGLTVQAGANLMDFINYVIEQSFAGLEALSGIPGTVGGAIVGNAGAYGQTISDTLVRVKIFDGKKVRWLSKKECKFLYRESIFKRKDWLVLEAEFDLKPGDKTELKKKSQEIIAMRKAKYAPSLKCPGSFFKNVLVKNVARVALAKVEKKKIVDGKIPAGYLLEEVGAKGMKFGNLEIAPFHGNLIINNGGATMKEVKKLANLLKKRVFKRFGIKLEEEVRYVV